jgi:hypothetical protein
MTGKLLVVTFSIVAGAAGCGGGGGGSQADASPFVACVEDDQCPSGYGCFRPAYASYCTTLCGSQNHCPDLMRCPSGEIIPDSAICIEEGQHKGQGVCPLYRGGFGPDNCADVRPVCTDATAMDGCTCSLGLEADLPGCAASDVFQGLCCAGTDWPDEGACSCRRRSCAVSTLGSSCVCGVDPFGDPVGTQCPDLAGTRCCVEAGDAVYGSCTCSTSYASSGCPVGATEVSNCTAEAVEVCGASRVRVDVCL